MEPTGDRRQEPRRTTDIELAGLTAAFTDLVANVHEIKDALARDLMPRLKDLEDWRIAMAATELERERNKHKEEANVISRRQFWFGIVSLLLAVLGATITLATLVVSHA